MSAAVLAAATAAVAAGCMGGREPPDHLADGSGARVAALELEGVDEPVVLSTVRGSDARTVERSSRIASCLDDGWSELPTGAAVHRVGIFGESVTFRGRSERSLHACDATDRTRLASGRWCGHSFGLLTGGVLRDPRLDLGGCTTSEGDPVAFAWVQPSPEARYVVVAQRGYGELYETSDGLPVRVSSTAQVDLERSRAMFRVSEHAGDGRRLRAYELEASVSG